MGRANINANCLDKGDLHYYGGIDMKKIELIVDIEKLEDIKEALHLLGVTDMTLSGIMGDRRCRNRKVPYYKRETAPVFLHKFKIEAIVSDSILIEVINQVMKIMNLSSIQDGSVHIRRIESKISF